MANDPAKRNSRIAVLVMAAIMVAGSLLMTYFMHRSSQQLVASLDSSDPDSVSLSLSILKARRDPAGIARATQLLTSDNVDVWTGAAMYLGTMGKSESIPYLIKALQTADEQDGREISLDLTMMTGVDFGGDYAEWEAWWMAKTPS